MTEEWRDIPGYEGLYQVSDAGNVRRLEYVTVVAAKRNRWGGVNSSTQQTVKAGPMTLRRKDSGHLHVALFKDGVRSDRMAHCLVMLAFVGPCPASHEVLHRDDIKDHNALGNLRYGTRSDNLKDCYTNGRRPRNFAGTPWWTL